MKAKPLLIFAAVAAALIFTRRRAAGIGKLSDNEVELDNILMGVQRGWYTARPDVLNGMYVVYLAGQKTDGERTEDVYPISKQTYDALVLRGVGALPRVKRRIYKEVSLAQSAGVDFSKKFDELDEHDILTLETVGADNGWKQSKRAKEAGKSYAESYCGSLKRAWNAVSGCEVEGVGKAYNVKDADGNIVLTWIEDAAAHVEAERKLEQQERELRKARNAAKRRQRDGARIMQEEFAKKLEEKQKVTPLEVQELITEGMNRYEQSLDDKRRALLEKAQHMDIYLWTDGTKNVKDPNNGWTIQVDNIITARGDDRYNYLPYINYVVVVNERNPEYGTTYYPIRAFKDRKPAQEFAKKYKKWEGHNAKAVFFTDVKLDAISGVGIVE